MSKVINIAIIFGLFFLLGCNSISENEEEKIDVKKVDNSIVLANQLKRLEKLKSDRNSNDVEDKLEKIRSGIKQNKNVLELAVNAPEDYGYSSVKIGCMR